MSWWKRCPCSSLTAPRSDGKKSRCEWRKWSFKDILQLTRYTIMLQLIFPQYRYSLQICCFPRNLKQIHKKAFQASVLDVLNVALKASEQCSTRRISGPLSTSSFSLAMVLDNQINPAETSTRGLLSCQALSHRFSSNQAWCAVVARGFCLDQQVACSLCCTCPKSLGF